MTDDVAEASPRPDAPPPRNKGGRPKSDTITLAKQARDRFNRKVVQNIDTLFDALFDAATKDGDVNAARLLIDRAIPSRRGAPIHFPLRPLKTAQDCADVLTDLLSSVAEGQLTPDEASQLSGIVSKRAELFGIIELASEIDALKAQLAVVMCFASRRSLHAPRDPAGPAIGIRLCPVHGVLCRARGRHCFAIVGYL